MLSMEEQAERIKSVLGQKPRTSPIGFAGERNPMPYAAVEKRNGALLFIHGESEADAMAKLFAFVARDYPSIAA